MKISVLLAALLLLFSCTDKDSKQSQDLIVKTAQAVSASDCCVLVAEPTAFGFHNFKMVHKLATLLKKPCFVIINKQDVPYGPLESFCEETETPILLRVPYSPKLAKCGAEGRLAYEEDGRAAELFDGLLKALRQGAAK